MSEEKLNKEIAEKSSEEMQQLEKGTVSQEPDEDEEVERGPLSPDEFRSALQSIDDLGLTWTADIPPFIKSKEGTVSDVLTSDEYIQIKRKFPNLPSELSNVVFYALTGSKKVAKRAGNEEDLQQKVAAVNEYVITSKYRFEFFFKYAIKVPYLSDVDWEVVIKAREKNVEQMPGIAYALLSLIFRQPVNPTLPAMVAAEMSSMEMYTVAVDEELVDKIIASLGAVKNALRQSQQLADSLSDESAFKGDNHGEFS